MAEMLQAILGRSRAIREMVSAVADEGRSRKGRPRTEKTPVLGIIERPLDLTAGEVRTRVVEDLLSNDAGQVFEETVAPSAHLMSDEAKTFMALG